jgi:hypothetical protein
MESGLMASIGREDFEGGKSVDQFEFVKSTVKEVGFGCSEIEKRVIGSIFPSNRRPVVKSTTGRLVCSCLLGHP